MASLGTSASLWRSLAPRLSSKELFTCRQCLHNQGYAAKSIRRFGAMPSLQPNKIHSPLFSDKNRQFFTSSLRRSAAAPGVANVVEESAAKAKSSFPKISDKSVAYFLLASAASVFGIVVFGGLTRLTESGYGHNFPIYKGINSWTFGC
jgi:cytochrome c oxidase assembly protein subunit 15